jgi:hypothetical protein
MPTFRLLILALATGLAASTVPAQTFELNFWPSPEAAKDPRVIRIDEHPCGEVAVARVSVIPPYKKGAVLTPERVLETSRSGKVISRWWLPTDSFIRAIRGNTLTIEHASKIYEVQPGGRISHIPMRAFPEEAQKPNCKVPAELLPSDYAICEVFKDAKTTLSRLLAYEVVCT